MEEGSTRGKVDDMMLERLVGGGGGGENHMNTRLTDKSTPLI